MENKRKYKMDNFSSLEQKLKALNKKEKEKDKKIKGLFLIALSLLPAIATLATLLQYAYSTVFPYLVEFYQNHPLIFFSIISAIWFLIFAPIGITYVIKAKRNEQSTNKKEK